MSVRDDTLKERFCSLHSKRLRASSSRKLGREQKKKGMRGEGGRERYNSTGNACYAG